MSYSEWEVVKLSTVLDFYNGKVRPKMQGNIPVFGGNGIMDYANAYNYSDENIIIGRVGAYCGNVNYYYGKLWISDNAINIKPKESLSYGKYVYYLLKNQNLHNRRIGSSQPLITQTILKNIEVRIPPMEEQKAIANILSSLDDKIELNNKINKNLEEMAQALYKQWFVDFEFPNEDGEPYKSSGGEMIDSELGLIPKGWEIDVLTNIANYKNGLAVKKYAPAVGEKSLPVLKIKELRNGDCDENSDRVTMDFPKEYIIHNGDLIFSWSGTLLVDFWTGKTAGLNQHLFKVDSDNHRRWFYYYWTSYHLDKFQNIAASMATTMGHIKRSDLNKSKVLIPDQKTYQKATHLFEPILDKMIQGRNESTRIKSIRDTLLPKLMSGEIHVNA